MVKLLETPRDVKTACLIDNRLHPEDLLFSVYQLSDRLQRFSLTRNQLHLEWDHFKIGVVNDHLFINGEMTSSGLLTVKEARFFVVNAQKSVTRFFVIHPASYFMISNDPGAGLQIQGEAEIVLFHDSLMIQVKDDFAYFNERQLSGFHRFEKLHLGDRLLTPEFLLEKRRDQWKITTFTRAVKFDLTQSLEQEEADGIVRDFPEYRRSPRLYLTAPTDKVVIQKIEEEQKGSRYGILSAVLPPLGMVAAMVIMSFFVGRNAIFMIGMGFMSVLTSLFSVTNYFSQKKDRKIQNLKRLSDYEHYLLATTAKLSRLHEEERQVLLSQNPTPKELLARIKRYDPSIYERTITDKDFLTVSLGTGTLKTGLTIQSDLNERHRDEASRRVEALVKEFSSQDEVPVPLCLRGKTVGFVGNSEILKTALTNLFLQLAYFQSYQDVNFITLVSEEDYQEEWLHWRFLPHFKIQALNTRGLVHEAQSRDLILNSFYHLLISRKLALREAEGNLSFTPHYVLTIFDARHLLGHSLNEFLAEDLSRLGVTVIWCKEDKRFLSETVTTLVEYQNSGAGQILTDQKVFRAQTFSPYPQLDDLETATRQLANLDLVEVEKSAIPTSVTFLEMYKVKTVGELEISQRWARGQYLSKFICSTGNAGQWRKDRTGSP